MQMSNKINDTAGESVWTKVTCLGGGKDEDDKIDSRKLSANVKPRCSQSLHDVEMYYLQQTVLQLN